MEFCVNHDDDDDLLQKNPIGGEFVCCEGKAVLQPTCTGLRNVLSHLRSTWAC
jgi:hypothetical protein